MIHSAINGHNNKITAQASAAVWIQVLPGLFWSLLFFMRIPFPLRFVLPDLFDTYDVMVDVLPDFIGWIILLIAFSRLDDGTDGRKGFMWLCGIALFAAVVNAFFSPLIQHRTQGRDDFLSLWLVINLIRFYLIVIEVWIFWLACSAISNVAKGQNRRGLGKAARLVKAGYGLMPLWFLSFFALPAVFFVVIPQATGPSLPRMFFLMLLALISVMFSYGLRIAAMVVVHKTRKLLK